MPIPRDWRVAQLRGMGRERERHFRERTLLACGQHLLRTRKRNVFRICQTAGQGVALDRLRRCYRSLPIQRFPGTFPIVADWYLQIRFFRYHNSSQWNGFPPLRRSLVFLCAFSDARFFESARPRSVSGRFSGTGIAACKRPRTESVAVGTGKQSADRRKRFLKITGIAPVEDVFVRRPRSGERIVCLRSRPAYPDRPETGPVSIISKRARPKNHR